MTENKKSEETKSEFLKDLQAVLKKHVEGGEKEGKEVSIMMVASDGDDMMVVVAGDGDRLVNTGVSLLEDEDFSGVMSAAAMLKMMHGGEDCDCANCDDDDCKGREAPYSVENKDSDTAPDSRPATPKAEA